MEKIVLNIKYEATVKWLKKYFTLIFKTLSPRYKIIVLEDIYKHFIEKQAEDNRLWKPLSVRYARWKLFYKFGMSVGMSVPTDPFTTDANILTGNLRRSALQTIPSEEIDEQKAVLTFKMVQLIPYAYKVQLTRRFFWISKAAVNQMNKVTIQEILNIIASAKEVKNA